MRGMLLHWEESMRWIARGWDCSDEYEHDVFSRLLLAEALDKCRQHHVYLPESFLKRMAQIDRAFRRVTYDSNICCWMTGYGYREKDSSYFREQEAKYPKRHFWFLYRWPLDARPPASELPHLLIG